MLSLSPIVDPVRDVLNLHVRHFSRLVGWANIAVAVGVAMEGVELIHDAIAWIKRRRLKKNELVAQKELAELFPAGEVRPSVESHSDHPRWVKRFTRIGLIVVVAGVMAEWKCGAKLEDAHNAVHEYDLAKLTEADQKAGEAAKSAKTAHEEAEAARVESATAKTDAADAVAKAQAAERSLAKAEADAVKAQTAAENALTTATDAGARAGKAEASLGKAEAAAKDAEASASNALALASQARREAASFESDLARLKQQAADRVLDEYQQEEVKRRIWLFSLTPYELAAADTPEAEDLVTEIDAAVGSAGWVYKGSESKAFRFIDTLRHSGHGVERISGLRGVEIGVAPASAAKLKSAAAALAEALNAEGISTLAVALPEDDPSPNNIHIMVGSKP